MELPKLYLDRTVERILERWTDPKIAPSIEDLRQYSFASGKNEALTLMNQPHIMEVDAQRAEGLRQFDAAAKQYIDTQLATNYRARWREPQTRRRFEIVRRLLTENITQKQIAAEYGLTEKTVASQMSYTRDDLWPLLDVAGRWLLSRGGAASSRGMALNVSREDLITAPRITGKRTKATAQRKAQAATLQGWW